MNAEKVVIGDCELWHGDCREILPGLPKFDLILTHSNERKNHV